MQIQFPQEVGLRDARRVIIRPFTEQDADALFEFFQRMPESMQRLSWDRIERRATVDRWAQNLDYERVVPLLAFDGTRIVADATLHYRDAGPLRRVGRIKWLIDPDYRGAGIGTAAITTFIEMARQNGLRRLTCMLVADLEADAITTLKRMGFEEYRIPEYGTDPDGNQIDMAKMVLTL